MAKIDNKFVYTVRMFMEDYEGFDWSKTVVFCFKSGKTPLFYSGQYKVILAKYLDRKMWNWTHNQDVMIITVNDVDDDKEEKVLISLRDGAIYDVVCDDESHSGCETCDYGSRYINEIEIKLSKPILRITATKMYRYAVSEGWLMTTILSNIPDIEKKTEQEFIDWFVGEIEKICPEGDCYGTPVYGVKTKVEPV